MSRRHFRLCLTGIIAVGLIIGTATGGCGGGNGNGNGPNDPGGKMPPLLTPYRNKNEIRLISAGWSNTDNAPWHYRHWGIDFHMEGREAHMQAVAPGTISRIELFLNEGNGTWQVNAELTVSPDLPNIGYAFECFGHTYEQGQKQLENIAVREGDTVEAGDLIGVLLYFDNPDFDSATLHFGLGEMGGDICPAPYFTEAAKTELLELLHIWYPNANLCYY